MRIRAFVCEGDRLKESPAPPDSVKRYLEHPSASWVDVDETESEQLRALLEPLDLQPSLLERCLNRVSDPGVVSGGGALLTEYPAVIDPESQAPAFLSILLSGSLILTIRHGTIDALDGLIDELVADQAPVVTRATQIAYMILDELADLNVRVQMSVRDEIQRVTLAMAQQPDSVTGESLSRLRWKVGGLVALLEDQLYCVAGLKASDDVLLLDPHRESFLGDLLSETEIAQRAVYRLETRLNDLYRDYQVASGDRVEKRLRVLTIVSAITLPLGLVTGLLGMNVGGIPGQSVWFGFLVVLIFMVVVFVAEFWYFKKKGWFD